MSFAAPAALWGLLGLLVPLLIHLFNAERGRRLAFGDTRFLDAAQAEQMQNLVPSEWLLLALRMALLVLVVLWLAQPRWQPTPEFRGRAAVLISPLALERANAAARVTARDLAAAQSATLRLLAPGFPPVDHLDHPVPVRAGAWELVAELDRDLPQGLPLVLLVADDPRESGWRRPILEREVRAVDIVPGSADSVPPVRFAVAAAPDRQADAAALVAALAPLVEAGALAAAAGGDSPVQIRFALGEVEPAPAPLLIRDAARPGQPRILTWQGRRFALRADPLTGPGQPLGHSLDGQPTVLLGRTERGAELRWASRFHPDHAEIVGDAAFAGWMDQLLRQALPGYRAEPDLPAAPAGTKSDPLPGWPLLIAALWLLERWLAYRRPA